MAERDQQLDVALDDPKTRAPGPVPIFFTDIALFVTISVSYVLYVILIFNVPSGFYIVLIDNNKFTDVLLDNQVVNIGFDNCLF